MLKILGQPGATPMLSGIREEDFASPFHQRRVGVQYEETDAEELVHLLTFLAEFGERTGTHPDELPHIMVGKHKREPRNVLCEFAKFSQDDRSINGTITVRFEYRGFTRWLIMAYIDKLMIRITREREELDGAFEFDLSDPLFYPRSITEGHHAQKHWEAIRNFYMGLLKHFPDPSTMN